MSEDKKKEKRPKSKARRIIEWVLVGFFGVIFAFAAAATIDSMIHKKENYGESIRFGVGTFVVRTDSMEPEYKVKSAIVTYKKPIEEIVTEFEKGETVDLTFIYAPGPIMTPLDKGLTYQTNASNSDPLYGTPMTHRLREIKTDTSAEVGKGRYLFIVAGINDRSGEWKINQYQVVSDEYVLGQVILNSDFLGGVFGFIASPMGLFVLLLIPAFYLVITSVIDIFRTLKESEEEPALAGGAPKLELSEKDKARLKQEMLAEMIKERQSKSSAPKAQEDRFDQGDRFDPKATEDRFEMKKDDKLSGISDEDKARLKTEMFMKMKQEEPKKDDKLAGISDDDKARLKAEMLMKMKQEELAKKQESKKEDKLAGLSDEDRARLKAEMLMQMKKEEKK